MRREYILPSPGSSVLPADGCFIRQIIQKLTASSNTEVEAHDWDRRVQTMRGNFLEHFVAGARRYLDKKYPTHGQFGARNRDRFFHKVEQGLKVGATLFSRTFEENGDSGPRCCRSANIVKSFSQRFHLYCRP